MAKRKIRRKSSSRSHSRARYSSRVDGHPLFTALFLVFCLIIAAIALFTLTLHKLGEEADEHLIITSRPTPIATTSPAPHKTY